MTISHNWHICTHELLPKLSFVEINHKYFCLIAVKVQQENATDWLNVRKTHTTLMFLSTSWCFSYLYPFVLTLLYFAWKYVNILQYLLEFSLSLSLCSFRIRNSIKYVMHKCAKLIWSNVKTAKKNFWSNVKTYIASWLKNERKSES